MKKTIFKIKGMHCTSCSMMIDGNLEDTDGVKSARTNYAKQQTEVEFDETKISSNNLLEIVKKTGYEAEELN